MELCRCTSAVVTVLFLSAQCVSTVPATTSSWSLGGDFSGTQNPNGQFAYGYSNATPTHRGQFQLFDLRRGDNVSSVAWGSSQSNLLGTPEIRKNIGSSVLPGRIAPGEVALHAGCLRNELCVVRWTAAEPAVYRVSAMFGVGNIGYVVAYVYVRDAEVWRRAVTTTDESFANANVTLSVNDTIYFAVGIFGSKCGAGATPLNATVSIQSYVHPTATASLSSTAQEEGRPSTSLSLRTMTSSPSRSLRAASRSFTATFSERRIANETATLSFPVRSTAATTHPSIVPTVLRRASITRSVRFSAVFQKSPSVVFPAVSIVVPVASTVAAIGSTFPGATPGRASRMPVVGRSMSTRSRCRGSVGEESGSTIDKMQFVAVFEVSGSHAIGALLSSVLTQGALFFAALVSSKTTVARGGLSPMSPFARFAVVAQLMYAASVCYFGPNVVALAVLTISRRSTDSASVSRGVVGGCLLLLLAQLALFVFMLVALKMHRAPFPEVSPPSHSH